MIRSFQYLRGTAMLDRIVSDIHNSGLEPDAWPATLARVSNLLGGASVFLSHESLLEFGAGAPWVHEYDPQVYHSAAREMFNISESAAMRHLAGAPLGKPYDRREFLGDTDRDPVARHFLGDAGLEHAVFCTTQRSQKNVSIVAFGREARRSTFGLADVSTIGRLCRHIGLAMNTHVTLQRTRQRSATFAAAIDHLSDGVILADHALGLRHANTAAAWMLETNDGLSLRRGRLVAEDATAHRQLVTAVRRLSAPVPDPFDIRIMVRRRSGAMPYVISLRPALGDALPALGAPAHVILFVTDPELALVSPNADRLGEDFGLTPAEARVACIAVQALSVPMIAARLGVTENTIKTHLKAVYEKLGVRTRAEFVRFLTAAIPSLIQ